MEMQGGNIHLLAYFFINLRSCLPPLNFLAISIHYGLIQIYFLII